MDEYTLQVDIYNLVKISQSSLDKYIWQFGQIHFAQWTYTIYNHDQSTSYPILMALPSYTVTTKPGTWSKYLGFYLTNTICLLDKYILQVGQIYIYNVYHLQIWPINFLPDSNGSALLDIDHKTRGQSFDQNIFLRFNQRNHLSFVSTRVFAAFGRWTLVYVRPEYRLRRSWVTHSRNQGFEQPFRCSDLVFEIYPSLFLDTQPYMTHLFS